MVEGGRVDKTNKIEWNTPELQFDGYLRDLVQSGGGKTLTGAGDGPDPFQPKGTG